MTSTEYGVVVAVGSDGIHDGALALAASEALRRRTGIELLHVVHALVAMPSSAEQVQSLDDALATVGMQVLTDAADRLRPRLAGRVPLTTELATGRVAASIADRAADAELVVLERRDAGTVERLLTMSVSTRVAAHAGTPVAVVPASWRPQPGEELPVTVGVDRPLDAIGQVETALAYARDRSAPLTVLHATWLAEPYQDIVFSNGTPNRWVHEAEHELELALAKLPGPTDDVTRDVQWRRPVDALVGATRLSAILVLSRLPPHGLGPHLGAVTRTVLRHAEGPVLVVART